MATLLLRSAGIGEQVLELHLGCNRFGRNPACDFVIDHAGVSALHCELELTAEGVVARDCNSTNGTYLDGTQITEASIQPGQVLRLGTIDLLVESVEANVAIPNLEVAPAGPPVVLPDGTLLCPRHPQAPAEFQCSRCREVLCPKCVHVLRRSGGTAILLCPLCSNRCERILHDEKPEKKSFLSMLRRTIALPFLRKHKK